MAKSFTLLQVFDVIPVRELETRLQQYEEVSGLHYDFLSNVAPSIQDIIENKSQQEILNWTNTNDPTTSFLADTTTEVSSLNIISTNTTVGRNSFIKDTVSTITQTEFSSARKIGIGEVAPIEASFNKIGVLKNSPSKIDIVKTNLSERSPSKISPRHITIFKITFIYTGADKFSTAQVTFVKPTGIEVGVGEVGLMVNNSFVDSIPPVSTSAIPASLISFSPSVLSNQFFSIHDSTPQIINDLNTIATNIWSDLLNPETPLNITFQVTNLPNGQLAEAQITSFDTSRMPNAGTICKSPSRLGF